MARSWLLIKENDEFARRGSKVTEEQAGSVVSGRTIEEIAADPDRVWHSNKSVEDNVKSGAVHRRKPRFDLAKMEGARKAAMPGLGAAAASHAREGSAAGR